MLKFAIFAIIIFFGMTACSKSETMDELKKHSEQVGLIIIDVRTQGEFNAGHVKGAKLIPYNEIKNKIESETKDKNAPIAVYCRSGSRSGTAKSILNSMGYTNVLNYGSLGLAKSVLEKK